MVKADRFYLLVHQEQVLKEINCWKPEQKQQKSDHIIIIIIIIIIMKERYSCVHL